MKQNMHPAVLAITNNLHTPNLKGKEIKYIQPPIVSQICIVFYNSEGWNKQTNTVTECWPIGSISLCQTFKNKSDPTARDREMAPLKTTTWVEDLEENLM